MNNCKDCNLYKDYKKLLINNYESVFDAVAQMGTFIEICKKSCSKNNNNCIKN